MKKTAVSIIITIISIGYLFAEETEKKNALGLKFGLGHIARQDLIFSPFIHTDISFLNVGMEYERNSKLYHKLSIRYAGFSPMLSQPFEFTKDGKSETAYPHSFNMIDMDYLIGKNIRKNQKSTTTIGALLASDIQTMNYVYGRISSFGYYAAFSLGAFARQSWNFSPEHQLAASLQLPFLSWLARSPYLVNDDEFIENISSHSGFKSLTGFISDGRFASLNKLQTFDFNLKYIYTLNHRWQFGADYLLEFIHASQPRNLLSYRQSLNLSARLSF